MKEVVGQLKVVESELVSSYEEVYIGKKVYKVTLADGSTRLCEQITKKKEKGDAVVIIPITVDGNFLMILQSRPNAKDTVVAEFPAGMVDKGESNKESAERELLEETGYEAEELYELEWHYQDQGCSQAIITTYVATGCRKVREKKLDGGERLEYFELSYDDILDMIRNTSPIPAEISDANTKIAFMTYTMKEKGLL